MKNKVVLVLIDALGYDEAVKRGGYLEALVEHGRAAKYRVTGELPALSRPMYETMMTGLPPVEHGVTSNRIVRRSAFGNLFSITRAAGLSNAAAAYGWVLELYGTGRAFDPVHDVYHLDGAGDIAHGIFYIQDEYPCERLFADAEYLRARYDPDFLLAHPMDVDLAGHRKGAGSFEYGMAASRVMDQLATLIPDWTQAGYDVIVTADHGMDHLGLHEGNEEIQRRVPLYIVSGKVTPGDYSEETLTSTVTAPLVLALLGIERADGMRAAGSIHGLATK